MPTSTSRRRVSMVARCLLLSTLAIAGQGQTTRLRQGRRVLVAGSPADDAAGTSMKREVADGFPTAGGNASTTAIFNPPPPPPSTFPESLLRQVDCETYTLPDPSPEMQAVPECHKAYEKLRKYGGINGISGRDAIGIMMSMCYSGNGKCVNLWNKESEILRYSFAKCARSPAAWQPADGGSNQMPDDGSSTRTRPQFLGLLFGCAHEKTAQTFCANTPWFPSAKGAFPNCGWYKSCCYGEALKSGIMQPKNETEMAKVERYCKGATAAASLTCVMDMPIKNGSATAFAFHGQ